MAQQDTFQRTALNVVEKIYIDIAIQVFHKLKLNVKVKTMCPKISAYQNESPA
jgi:hypothetical protein